MDRVRHVRIFCSEEFHSLTYFLCFDPSSLKDAEEEVFEMIGEVDSKGTGEIDLEDFIKMVSMNLGELPGEATS